MPTAFEAFEPARRNPIQSQYVERPQCSRSMLRACARTYLVILLTGQDRNLERTTRMERGHEGMIRAALNPLRMDERQRDMN